jgi:hypothetical protein
MTKNNPKKNHAKKVHKNKSKSPPPSSLSPEDSKEIFSSRKHSMDYVTVNGVMLRTGYHDKSDWYLLCIKELLDNSIDFLWKNYQGADDATITVDVTKNDCQKLFHIKIRNTNTKNIPVFQSLSAIFDYDMRYGSKQNQHIISRGMLGDAMKQILAWPYVLIHTKDDGTAFVDRQWDKPLIIRNNGIERHVFLHVDKSNQTIEAQIIQSPNEISCTDTEIEIIWPIIDEINLDIHRVEKFCRQYIVFTTDISFQFRLITEHNNTSPPAHKATIKIDVPRLHSISTGWNNISSIHSYKPEGFVSDITSVHDKQNTSVYDVLRKFREGTNMKKTADTQISIAELMQDLNNKDRKIEAFYHQLQDAFAPPKKLSTPYSNVKLEQRKQALIERIAQRYHPNKLNITKAVYKVIHGNYDDNDLRKVLVGEYNGEKTHYTYEKGLGILHYPFVIEIIAIPLSDHILNQNTNQPTKFIGSVNYSVSPRGNKFEGDYSWYDKKRGYTLNANSVVDILERYGFAFYDYFDAKTKLPCIIAANLVSPRIDYHGHDKSHIDTQPFKSVIIEAVRKIAEDIQTFRAAGYYFVSERRLSEFYRPTKKMRAEDALIELFEKRNAEILLVQQQYPTLPATTTIDEWTQDSVWYNFLPIKEKYGIDVTRDYLKRLIRTVCEKLGVTREQLGIVAAPWATMYYDGKWTGVSFDVVKALANNGVAVIFIEKLDIVRVLGKYADKYGVALVNTHGHLVAYAKDLANAAKASGAHVAIVTDYDIPGVKIASEVSEGIAWLGVDEETLTHFGLSKENKQIVIAYEPKKQRITPYKFRKLVESDGRFRDVDIEFLQHKKVEIDAVLTSVGSKRLWEYFMNKLEKLYSTWDYNRAISSKPSLLHHYPQQIQNFKQYLNSYVDSIVTEEQKKIESELEKVNGFIDIAEKAKEIDKRLGAIVENDEHMREIASKTEEMVKKGGYDINQIKRSKDYQEEGGSENSDNNIS